MEIRIVMKGSFVVILALLVVGCKPGSSDKDQPDRTVEDADTFAGSWVRACSPVDDMRTLLVFEDGDLLPVWWIERLEFQHNKVEVSRTLYVDDLCETEFAFENGSNILMRCYGVAQGTVLVQDTYAVHSFPYSDDRGLLNNSGSCDLLSEPAMNLYPVGDVMYRAYYTDPSLRDSSSLVVDFNKVFERVE